MKYIIKFVKVFKNLVLLKKLLRLYTGQARFLHLSLGSLAKFFKIAVAAKYLSEWVFKPLTKFAAICASRLSVFH